MENENTTNNLNVNTSESTVSTSNGMHSNVNNSSNSHTVTNASQIRVSDTPDETNTAIIEYLDIVKSEYEIERGKKESFENRAGIILALISALFVFAIDKILISDIINLFTVNLTFLVLLKLIFGIFVYLGLAYALIYAFITISARKQDNFNIESIDMLLLSEIRMNALARLILAYRKIILCHREINEKRAKSYKKSLYGSIVSILSIVIYLSLKW